MRKSSISEHLKNLAHPLNSTHTLLNLRPKYLFKISTLSIPNIILFEFIHKFYDTVLSKHSLYQTLAVSIVRVCTLCLLSLDSTMPLKVQRSLVLCGPSYEALNFAVCPSSTNCRRGLVINSGDLSGFPALRSRDFLSADFRSLTSLLWYQIYVSCKTPSTKLLTE